MAIIGRLIEFGIVLVVSAIIGYALAISISDTSLTPDIQKAASWGAFFVVPMFYYGLFHVKMNVGGGRCR